MTTAITIVLGATLAKFVVDTLFGLRSIRAFVSGPAHVEGYWYLTTDSVVGDPLSPDGILFLSHEASGETHVVTTRVDGKGREYTTAAEIAYVRGHGSDLKYINYFRLTYPGSDSPFGLSAGKFVRSDDRRICPDRFEALISLTGSDFARRQSAQRIPDKVVRRLTRDYGDQWKRVVLSKAGRDLIYSIERGSPNTTATHIRWRNDA